MSVTIYHNPSCSNSRDALAAIRARGIEPVIVEYLKTPLTRDQLRALVEQMGVPVRDVVRWKEKLITELKIENADDGALLDAMAAHPVLMNRPIVVTPKGAKLCRPGETVADIL